MAVTMFPDLQFQCLYSVVGRLEEYTSSTLSLLPVSLRRQLLLRLPVADLCRLDGDTAVMNGINNEALWREVLRERIKFHYKYTYGESLKKHSTAKDAYLNQVTRCLLTNEQRLQYMFRSPKLDSKSKIISFLLYGIPLECDTISLRCFWQSSSLGVMWAVPQRYTNELAQVDTLTMVKSFLTRCNWYPRSLELTEDDTIDQAFDSSDSQIFRSFMSCVECVHVEIGDYAPISYPESLKSLWQAIGTSIHSSLTAVSLSACITNLGELIYTFLDGVFNEGLEDKESAVESEKNTDSFDDDYDDEDFYSAPSYKLTGLKRLELLGNDGGTNPSARGYTGYLYNVLEDIIQFLKQQNGLEILIIDGFQNIVKCEDEDRYGESESSFEGFEGFYNYLPHIISKPSFKFLRVEHCEVPSNTIESMISVFLSSPTSHAQTLELECCYIGDQSFNTESYDYSLIKLTETQCRCGEFKSLSFLANSSRVPLQWLFQYPGLHLKRLELFFNAAGGGESDLESFSESLNTYPRDSIETLCITLYGLGYGMTDKDVQALQKILQLRFISELGLINCYCESGNMKDGLLSILSNAFSRLTSLQRCLLRQPNVAYRGPFLVGKIPLESTSPYYADFRSFFDALFSMPKEQLAEFTLDMSENSFDMSQQEEIVKAWKANARGQKLKELIYTPRGGSYDCMGSMSNFDTVFESFPELAVNVDVGIVP